VAIARKNGGLRNGYQYRRGENNINNDNNHEKA